MLNQKIFKAAVFFGVLLVPGLLFAQRGTLKGKVVDTKTGEPLPGASVVVEDLDIGSATNIDGEFTITGVPVGERVVLARFIGYRSVKKAIRVTSAETEVNFELIETVLQLDEIVITGAGVASEKRRLGNTVATINASALDNAAISNVSEMLTAREPGVSVLPSGGLTGEGARIRIRGTASLSTNNEPIIYVDGVRIDNFGGFAGDVYAGGGGVPSRLDDINPAAIERIEVLKGAAAATLYGTQASNGIIQIFTKKGTFGKPQFSLEIEQGAISYPDAYPLNTGFARDQETADTMSRVLGQTVRPFELVSRPWVKDQFSTGYAQTYNLSVSGGGSGVTYFAAGRFQRTNGPIDFSPDNFGGLPVGDANDILKRGQFSANINIVPSNRFSLRVSTLYSNVNQSTIENNNNIFAPITLAEFGKPEFVSDNNPLGQVAFATVREASFQEIRDETDHASISLNMNYKINSEVTVDATGGLDFVSQRSSEFRPFGWNVDNFAGQDPQGALQLGKREHKEWTVDIKANWTRSFTQSISSTFLAGFQGFNTINNISDSDVDVFPGPGLEVLDAAANQTTVSRFSEVINAGFFVQEQLGYKDYLYVTGGVRFDANSAFGTDFSTQAYPKVSLSFVPSSAFGFGGSFLSTLRVRGAIGQSGQQPGAFDQFTTFEPYNAETGAGVRPENLGNSEIKPEVSTEIEGGFEAGLFNDRLGLEFTYWDRSVNDALIARQFAPSGGFRRTQLDNIGQIDASGVDLVANFSLLKQENLSIEVFANAAYITEKITDLGGAPEQKVSGSYSRIRNYLRENESPGAFFGAKLADGPLPIDIDNDNIADSREALLAFFAEPHSPSDFAPVLVDEDGDGDFLDHFLGKPTPDWAGSFGAAVGFLKRFRFGSVFEYKAGNYYVTNLTDAFRKSHPAIGRNTPEAAATELVLLDPGSTAEQRLAAAVQWETTFRALAPYSGLNTIESADFIRVRELSLTYDLPRTVLARFGLRNASLTVAGRNLFIFTKYSGIDPESNWFGRGGAGDDEADSDNLRDNNFLDGVDAFGLPIPRQFVFKLRVGF